MTRTAYPIVQKLLIVLFLTTISGAESIAQVNRDTGTLPSGKSNIANPPMLPLFCFFLGIIALSVFYRRFMYNRLLARALMPDRNVAGSERSKKSMGGGLVEQVVEVNEMDQQQNYEQLVKNLQHTISVLEPTGNFFEQEEIRSNLQQTTQKLFTLTAIHDRFYYHDELKCVDLNEVVPLLIENISLAHGNHANLQFIYSSTSRNIELDIKQALAMTSIINEILFWFAASKTINFFSESVGFYLQESKGLIKLTVRADGLNITKDLRVLRRNLQQCMSTYFSESLAPQLQIDQTMGTNINFQVQKRVARTSQVI